MQKMSLVSDQAIFTVVDPNKPETAKHQQDTIGNGKGLASPITQFQVLEATPNHINLQWENVEDASDYTLYWDKGDQQETSLFYPLAKSTNGQNEYTVDKADSGGIMGSQNLLKHGGKFHFKVSYKSIKTK